MKKYLEQYERVMRWFTRLKNITEGREYNLSSDHYQDEVLAFFINCYHLKDWIKNDKSTKVTSEEVEDFVRQSEFLRVCGDICNGSKHLTITNPRSDKNTKVGGRNFSLNFGGIFSIFKARYKIISGKKKYDAFELASQCMEEWRRFLAEKNLMV